MRAPTAAGIAAFALLGGVPASADQLPLQLEPSQPVEAAKTHRALTGRFMHVTDFHPDPFYKKAATLASGCHRLQGEVASNKARRMKGKSRMSRICFDCIWDAFSDPLEEQREKSEELAGEWGTPVSDCDSPMTLIDLTFNWLKKEWDEQVDFILWTGDSVRHDIDNYIPRSSKEIFDLNQMMADRMIAAFGKKVPIIPSLGNNDVYPHNIMEPGPNRVTQEFLKIWKHFIPEEYRHVFERGGYFAVEVIPDQLAVISLNTIYYFQSNAAVDGCKPRSGEPGDLEMEWLEVQLQQFRDRGMQVHLIGHVAPHQGLYYDDCYLRYGDLALRYQDTIVGHHYGHQNIDHFFFMNVQELDAVSMGSAMDNGSLYLKTEPQEGLLHPSVDDYSYPGPEIRGPHFLNSGRFKIFGRKKSAQLKDDLRKSWRALPKISDLKFKDYAVINVAPSIIPTYQPAARIYSYNITGVSLDSSLQAPQARFVPDDPEDETVEAMKGNCAKKKNWDKPHCSFKTRPRYSSPDSPSRSNKAFTVLGYTQFYLPELDTKSTVPPGWQIEYTTFKATSLLPADFTAALGGVPYGQPPPVPFHLLPGFDPDIIDSVTSDDLAALDRDEFEEGEGAEAIPHNRGRNGQQHQDFGGISREEKKDEFLAAIRTITPWKLKDLTIKTYVKFAHRLADNNKAFKKFLDFMFVSSCPGRTC